MKTFWFLLFLTLNCNLVFAQFSKQKTDSLIHISQTTKDEKQRMKVLNTIAWNIAYQDLKLGEKYSLLAIEQAKKIKDSASLARAYNTIATIYNDQGKTDSAIEFQMKALGINKKLKLNENIGSNYANLGNIYANTNQLPIAKKYYLLAYDFISRESGTYASQMKLTMSLYQAYDQLGIPDSARYQIEKAYSLYDKIKGADDVEGFANALMADYQKNEGNLNKALDHLTKAEYFFKKTESPYDLFEVYLNFGSVYKLKKDYSQALQNYNKALNDYFDFSSLLSQSNLYNALSECYVEIGNYQLAYEFKNKTLIFKDSLSTQSAKDAMISMEKSFKQEKRNLELTNLKVTNSLQTARINEEKSTRTNLVLGIALLSILVFFILIGYRSKSKANRFISNQKVQVEIEKAEVESKNKEITASINYAKRLQEVMLPTVTQLNSLFKSHFILYKPKDIVAGDFYWSHLSNDYHYFAVADCTGHGVPGAMVSVVCSSALTRCVQEFNLKEPNAILAQTDDIVQHRFTSPESSLQDGMDISLIRINQKTNELTFSGANNDIWIYRKNEETSIVERTILSADHQPIGKYETKNAFTNTTFQLKKNDIIYLFTDGCIDQFGGPKGKKLKSIGLHHFLLTIQELSLENQKINTTEFLQSWMVNCEQLDDICMAAIQIV